MHNKRPGSVYEYQFFAKAMSLGFEVFVPAGDHLPQDCHVVNEAGRIFRVQIKGTRVPITYGKIPRFRLTTGQGVGNKNAIKCNDVDVLAGYVSPVNTFYIIPCEKLTGVSTWVYPNDPKAENKYKFEKYRENWDIFKEA